MKNSFTQSMAWLHTWGGLIFGWLLFAIFFTGTLSVFPGPITSWMQPELGDVRPASPDDMLAVAIRTLEREAGAATRWSIRMPNDERPALLISWRPTGTGSTQQLLLNPATGEALHPRETLGGAFFVRFHFSLLLERIGVWIVGVAVLMMLVTMVTGLVIHKKIFKDFFTFRPKAGGHRSWLDVHTAAGVLMLPFHVMISYTGLIVFVFTFMPAGIQMFFGGDRQAYTRALNEEPGEQARTPRSAAGVAVPLASLRDLVRHAEAQWGGLPVTSVSVEHPGDRNATVRLGHFSREEHELFGTETSMTFDGVTGTVLESPGLVEYKGVQGVRQVSFTLHTARLGGWPMKWLYFLMSAASSVTIATGLVMWTIKRGSRMKSALDLRGYRIVERLNVASIAGLIVATLAYFWANRLIPVDVPDRASIEVRILMAVWSSCLLHACLRPSATRAWREQLGLAALLAVTIPLLNALTGGTPLDRSVARGDWDLAGFDLTALLTGLLLTLTVWRIGRVRRAPVATTRRGLEAGPGLDGEGSTLPV